jgi:hypothetical protein
VLGAIEDTARYKSQLTPKLDPWCNWGDAYLVGWCNRIHFRVSGVVGDISTQVPGAREGIATGRKDAIS